MKTCTKCGETKPLDRFPPDAKRRDGRQSHCHACKAAAESGRRATLTAEQRADAQAAFRAGIRNGKCAVCSTSIDGRGLCETCEECVEVLGGLDGLKRAVRAVRYLTTRVR